jgi:hypothetical protein
VGLIPLFAVERLEVEWIRPFKEFSASFEWFLRNRPDLVRDVVHGIPADEPVTYALTIVNENQLLRLVQRICDPDEFLSPYGIRSLSKAHEQNPFVLDGRIVGYEPADAITKIKGGNSNWRGPIWFPTCFLLIESFRKLAKAFAPNRDASTEGKGAPLPFPEMAREIADRLIRIFMRDASGRRPVDGGARLFHEDPHWKDLPLFYEYFHGDNGSGLGASHQTGWTALVASLIEEWRR